ncbi:MAG: hypothetical protein WDN06_14075 [Asticcacaulis sp.]
MSQKSEAPQKKPDPDIDSVKDRSPDEAGPQHARGDRGLRPQGRLRPQSAVYFAGHRRRRPWRRHAAA